MRVCIIGWYGTETIGDRGILAGIFSLLHQSVGNFSVQLGSLYPYFTERTLHEDASFYKNICGKEIEIKLFDSRESKQLETAISESDLVIVGGGPLMHINAMFMLEYAFKRAKKLGKKTMLFGCGVGPLHKSRHQKATVSIAEQSDCIVLRDTASKSFLQELYKAHGSKWNDAKVQVSLDPSMQCLFDFQRHAGSPQADFASPEYIAVNMRAFPDEYSKSNKRKIINDNLRDFLLKLSENFAYKKIRLIPMHYFHIGNDDRDFLNTLALQLNKQNIEVQNINLSLEQTMEVFQNAWLNIGMRFHSVVFQTILNGRNFILDYTEPQKGKISGFLNDMDGNSFYKERYFNLQTLSNSQDVQLGLDNIDLSQKFSFDIDSVKKKLEVYATTLKSLA
ncbi:MAG: polysaccharide pyruvyl transferase family protein [Chitinophagales bacterium]|nr:polysaccharide pyruvyl transferase family protein [Chitinophagales bacterium]